MNRNKAYRNQSVSLKLYLIYELRAEYTASPSWQ